MTKLLDRAGAVHSAGGSGTITPTTDYYGSGNDDAFAEYGIATFTFNAAEFGGSIIDITDVSYKLTHNDRNFSDGTEFELFLTTDDFDASYSGIAYDDTGASDPSGLDQSQFTSISSLGTFPYTPEAGGTMENLTISLSAAQETALLSEINSGSEFSIIIAATALDADITFTGDDDNFEPGGQPELSITAVVPEPASLALLGFAVLAACLYGRRCS